MNTSAPPLHVNNRYAIFLDFDGTLTPLRFAPAEDYHDPALEQLLLQCHAKSNHALAIVTGRAVDNISTLIPLPLQFVGQHGLEFKTAQGEHTRVLEPGDDLTILSEALRPQLKRWSLHDDLENKGMGLALYHHQHPDHHHIFVELLQEAIDKTAAQLNHRYTLQRGKDIVEIKPDGHTKGTAINHLMNNDIFSGKTPIFFGDDLTDEHGFTAVNARGGITVKVGVGHSVANHRLENFESVRAWLSSWLKANN